ncbi:hypothetical protein F5B21DRAFT_112812 [Xylaria acuta]|nr:hypothetical protein F5B21DRAFT_112812 [Xylaria acuta]
MGLSCILQLAPGHKSGTGHDDSNLQNELLHASMIASYVLNFKREHVDADLFEKRCQDSDWQVGPCAVAVRDAMDCLRVKSFQHSAGWYTSSGGPRCVIMELQLSPEQQRAHDKARDSATAVRTDREHDRFLECLAFNPHLAKVIVAQEGTAGLWRACNGLVALTNRSNSSSSGRWNPEMRTREAMEAETKTILDGGLRFFYAAMQGGDTMLWPYPTSTTGWWQWLCCNSPVMSATIVNLSQAFCMTFDEEFNYVPKWKRVLVVVPDNTIIRLFLVAGLHVAGFKVVALHPNTTGQRLKEIGKWFTNKQDLSPGVLVTRLKEAEKLKSVLLARTDINGNINGDMDGDIAGLSLSTVCKTGIIIQPPNSSSRFLRTLALLPDHPDRPPTAEEVTN